MVVMCMSVLGSATAAAADSIDLAWNAGNNVGYKVHVGVQSGSYTQHFDVGAATAFTYPNAVAGQRYCFAISAYFLSSLLEGSNSSEVCGYSNEPPTLVNPGNRQSTVGQPTTLQLVGSDPASQPLTYSATGLPAGLSLMASTGFISGTPTTAATYPVTARAFDGTLTSTQSFTWTIVAGTTPDTTPPTVTITAPTSSSTYSATAVSISVGGTAADDRGVNQVSWTNDRGGSGVATGTTSWSLTNVPLVNGTNVITVTAVDVAGNRGTDSLTVTYTGSTADTTLPTVSISGPTSGTTFTTTSSALALSGTSADNLGVTQVTWTNDRGGSGVATGTTSWSAPSIALQTGTNNITVRARDAAGNQGTDLLTVTYTAPVTPPSGSVTLTGSASANLTTQLSWTANSWSTVDVYRNGNQEWHTYNDGAHTDTVPSAGTYSYYICSHLSKTICSNTIVVTF